MRSKLLLIYKAQITCHKYEEAFEEERKICDSPKSYCGYFQQ